MKLIVGLGNPGERYARNRHNVGFMALERIADRHRFAPWRRRFQGETADGEIGGHKALLLKPQTYMNESGRSVGEAVRFLKIDLAELVVVHDELDLAPGRLKIKSGGGNAGHNGLRSISAHLGNDYLRLRLGIGHPGHKDAVSGYVLHDFAKRDADWLEPLLDAIADAAGWLVVGEHARFQTEVAKALAPAVPAASKAPPPDRPAGGAGKSAADPPGGAKPHPTGDRMAKRQGAIADNLRKWLAAREPKG